MNIKRILIAIDASPYSLTALEAAAELAEKLEVELHGIYIEDTNLLRLAELPFAREFRYSRAASQKLDSSQMTEQLRLQAALARRHFDNLVTQRKLDHSFQVTRGVIANELQKATQESDILVMGRISRSLLQTTHLGSTAKTAVFHARPSLFLAHTTVDLNQPLLLVYDGSEAAERALTLAVQLGGRTTLYNILINTPDDGKAQAIKHHLDEYFQSKRINGSFRRLHQITLKEILYILNMTHSGILVINQDNEQLSPDLVKDLLETIECPVFIIK
jgi:nucleotide-binding universal stress UspA family protein